METFHEARLEDIHWVEPILQNSKALSSSSSFGSSVVWQKNHETKICHYKDFLLTAYMDEEGKINFIYPVGDGDEKDAIEFMLNYAKEQGLTPAVTCMGEQQAQKMESFYPGRFKTKKNRDIAEYIYLAEDLSGLRGRKYHGKRNHVKRFKEDNNWSFACIDQTNIEDAVFVAKEWCKEKGCKKGDAFSNERCALKETFAHFDALKMQGAIIKVDGQPVAMAIGEEINPECFIVHFEKAIGNIQGAYAAINNMFAQELEKKGYTYINREEDLGIEGMRKAKLSYRPVILLEKIMFSE